MDSKVKLIAGGVFKDERGSLTFFNDFNMEEVRRFYMIEHPQTSVVRAWQAHKIEQKWFCVISGSFKVVLVQPDDWENPSPSLKTQEFILRAGVKEVLHIPGNYANGVKALEPNSKMIIYSDLTREEAVNDNFRFDSGLWYDWNSVSANHLSK